ncbi:hypothetical protein BDP81DRAFT_411925 [Colletotrichum phormii]|uniref:Uncharacterized protein n=1 Tax=Colletotrichum phormii TaxID=359342 RepID=A0AAI9ZBV4_9PEZI|nr:uncharacterized protein BDP81DRAFT_411925 [Colletotrichum phormii]KAK1621653.1 hypothetical protein BDP81DRAFT_411925 [Colletotrichum phormii]
MAVLDELPPEIIRMVCAFLHPPDVPLNTVVADTGHLREEIIGHSAYHTISVPQLGIRPLLSLLRLIINKPAIGAAVKRLNLEMSDRYRLKEDEDEDELSPFTSFDILFIQQASVSAGVTPSTISGKCRLSLTMVSINTMKFKLKGTNSSLSFCFTT